VFSDPGGVSRMYEITCTCHRRHLLICDIEVNIGAALDSSGCAELGERFRIESGIRVSKTR